MSKNGKLFIGHHILRLIASAMLKARRLGETGTALVEFALLVPFLVLLMMGTTDFGRALYEQYRLNSAVASGANFGGINDTDAVDTTDITTLVQNSANNSALAPVVTQCYCPSVPSGTTGSVCSSSANCANYGSGGSDIQTAEFVQVTAQETFNTMVPYPFLPNNYVLTATDTAPVQQ